MTAPPDGNDPRRFAFWNEKNHERDVLTPFRHREHHEDPATPSPPGSRARRIAQIVFDVSIVIAWIVLIVLTLFFPTDVPDPRSGSYN